MAKELDVKWEEQFKLLGKNLGVKLEYILDISAMLIVWKAG